MDTQTKTIETTDTTTNTTTGGRHEPMGLTAEQVSEKLNVEKSLVYGFLKVLESQNLVKVIGKRQPAGGRGKPTVLYGLQPTFDKVSNLFGALSAIKPENSVQPVRPAGEVKPVKVARRRVRAKAVKAAVAKIKGKPGRKPKAVQAAQEVPQIAKPLNPVDELAALRASQEADREALRKTQDALAKLQRELGVA